MLAPGVEWALGLLPLRAALSQMDVPTRPSYVMAAAAGPALAGTTFAAGWQATAFILCGVLKIDYDLPLLWAFRHIRPPEEVGR